LSAREAVRAAALLLAAVEILAAVVLAVWALREAGGGFGIAASLALTAVPLVALTALPAAVLAIKGRHLWGAALLALLPLALAGYGRFG
jgi:hypothetical protein